VPRSGQYIQEEQPAAAVARLDEALRYPNADLPRRWLPDGPGP
jgi:hypothetical protein